MNNHKLNLLDFKLFNNLIFLYFSTFQYNLHMFKNIKFNLSNNKFMEYLTAIVWTSKKYDDKLKSNLKEIAFLRLVYAIVIGISCIISFLSLFDITITALKIIISIIQIITFFVFLIDYILHMLTYQYARDKRHLKVPFLHLRYFFSFNSIVIICCILASIHVVEHLGSIDQNVAHIFRELKIFNMMRIIRLFMVLTLFGPFEAIASVFGKQKKVLTSVFLLIVILIILFALVIWNNESNYLIETQNEYILKLYNTENQRQLTNILQVPKDFIEQVKTTSEYQALSSGYIIDFWSSIYFTTITLTTIGYGDYSPHAPVSRIIVSFIALMAIAIIAIPSGVIAGAFLTEM
ncbi:two pore domain potassium channel family protein [Mycoplasmopsis gallopavonis]|nr:two pore domain potassium channel family protein [Mycoplasmopsis gallopavonis]